VRRGVHRVVHNCARMYGSHHRTPRGFNVPALGRSQVPPRPQQKGHANKRGGLPQEFVGASIARRKPDRRTTWPGTPDLVRPADGAYPRSVSRLRRVPLWCTSPPPRGGQETTRPAPPLFVVRSLETDREQGQAHLPAQQPPSCQDPRVPAADAYPRWSGDPVRPSAQGSHRAVGLITATPCSPRRPDSPVGRSSGRWSAGDVVLDDLGWLSMP
jgi:hypothetical protein